MSIVAVAPRYKASSDFASVVIRKGGNSLFVSLTGVLIMSPRKFEHDEYGDCYKFGVKFDQDDLKVVDDALEALSKHTIDKWHPKEAHDEGTMFFKLKTDKDETRFITDIVPQLKPSKLSHDKISTDMDVTVDLAIAGWYQKSTRKFGLTFKVKKVVFGMEQKRGSKRKGPVNEEEE